MVKVGVVVLVKVGETVLVAVGVNVPVCVTLGVAVNVGVGRLLINPAMAKISAPCQFTATSFAE